MISRRALLGSLAAGVTPGACAVAMRVSDGRVLRCDGSQKASGLWAAPGSAVKPLTLLALPRRDALACGRRLRIGGHVLDCTHPPVAGAVDAETALAVSCNCWFAARAREMDAGLFQRRLARAGAEARVSRSAEELQLQALGVAGVRFTPMALAEAYRGLAVLDDAALRRGLERAVKAGTGQWAAPEGLAVAGKTGTSVEGAWFAGYAPAAAPKVVVAVFVERGRGSLDAAPVAREVFAWWRDSEYSR